MIDDTLKKLLNNKEPELEAHYLKILELFNEMFFEINTLTQENENLKIINKKLIKEIFDLSMQSHAQDFKELISTLENTKNKITEKVKESFKVPDEISIGERIRALRKEKGLTQDDVAKVLGVARPTITVYESGSTEPSLKHLRVLAKYFDVTFDELIDKTPD